MDVPTQPLWRTTVSLHFVPRVPLVGALRGESFDQSAKRAGKGVEIQSLDFYERPLAAPHIHGEGQERVRWRAPEWENRAARGSRWRSRGRGRPVETQKVGTGPRVDSRKLQCAERAERQSFSPLLDPTQFQRPVTLKSQDQGIS